jgi:hypothetical protein
MSPVLFKQSEVNDPYELYAQQLAGNPVYWDTESKVWGIYAYKDCWFLLNSPHTRIPALAAPAEGILNEYALLLLQHLVRLANEEQHHYARHIVLQLHKSMQPVSTALLLDELMARQDATTINWVRISKQLPLYSLLSSFRFPQEAIQTILSCIEQLITIMLPYKNKEQVTAINTAAQQVYQLTAQQLQTGVAGTLPPEQWEITTANLVGLMIQSYDAGRGILSNALLQAFTRSATTSHQEAMKKLVVETLRYDPPIHNTRRVLTSDMVIHNKELKAGDTAVLVLAAANRDPAQFEHPVLFDTNRPNNHTHLTFGFGAHACVAQHSAVVMATETLVHLFHQYPHARLLTEQVHYEPLVNARLPQQLQIVLH